MPCREGLFAKVAAIAARTGRGQADGLVAFADRDGVVGAGFIRAGWFWRNVQLLEETRTLLGNGHVALDSGILAAHAA